MLGKGIEGCVVGEEAYGVAQAQWLNIEECKQALIFEEFERGDLAYETAE